MERNKSSHIWNHFTALTSDVAQCHICDKKFSYRTTTTNLKKHIARKHPQVKLTLPVSLQSQNSEMGLVQMEVEISDIQGSQISQEGTLVLASLPDVQDSKPIMTSTPMLLPSKIPKCRPINKKQTLSAQQKLDYSLLRLFVIDLLPLRVLEEPSFREFLEAMNPVYPVPTKSAVSKKMLPSLYDQCYKTVKELIKKVKSVCITVETWVSLCKDTFLSVTAHFIDDFEYKSVFLDCVLLNDPNSSSDISTMVNSILLDWGLESKVVLAVSGPNRNVVKALKEELKLKHFVCFGQTLNNIINENLQPVKNLLEKVENIASFFEKNREAQETLSNIQSNWGIIPKKLMKNGSNQWNSLFYMLDTFVEIEAALKNSISILEDHDYLPGLTDEEWTIIKELRDVLKPFHQITETVQENEFLEGALVIVLTNGMLHICDHFLEANLNQLIQIVVKGLKGDITEKLGSIETDPIFSSCTYLDPRFKQIPFQVKSSSDLARKRVIDLVASKLIKCPKDFGEGNQVPSTSGLTVWDSFDTTLAKVQPRNPNTLVELNRYIEDPILGRNRNPMEWWQQRRYNFPLLSEIVHERCCALATSVPWTRLFTKQGEIFNDRRSRLSCNKVGRILFINRNLKFLERAG